MRARRTPTQKLPAQHEESIATAVPLSNDPAIVEAIEHDKIDPADFDEPFGNIVAVALEYRRGYNRAIGPSHTDDEFADELNNEKTRSQYNRILSSMRTVPRRRV